MLGLIPFSLPLYFIPIEIILLLKRLVELNEFVNSIVTKLDTKNQRW